jgi:hypothetical protein
MNADFLKKEFLTKYTSLGTDKFYKSLLAYSVKKMVVVQKENNGPILTHVELLDYSDQFIILYRREGDVNCLEISKIFRKIAHKLYRILLKNSLTNKNDKFLNLV